MSVMRQRLHSIGAILLLRPEIYWVSNYLTLRHICWNKAGMQVMFFRRVVETLASLL
nr:MAG TPA: hypothetical protein [Bacteriophage sp.]DAP27358.1 MAG TPA: hypothetical protein [Caudoviricetes sp.]DAQ83698.1 MAG TPA: hypothetical protein [Caudoviricetes sp.]DAZ02650.1 MAG TPA: hypothetical protein [Caudoviricetes sp.]